jgi:hypothetical protein
MAGAYRRNKISGTFAVRLIEMLKSPAFRVLSRAAHQVLARIEIEHAQHGGAENGKLPVTYDHFVEYGLHRHAIGPAIREAVALGFIEVTQRGCARNGEFHQPSLYRLTYRDVKGTLGDGMHEWRRIKSIEQAEALAKQARREVDLRASVLGRARQRKQNASDGFRQPSVTKTATETAKSPVTESATTGVSKTITTSISRGETPEFVRLDSSKVPLDACDASGAVATILRHRQDRECR